MEKYKFSYYVDIGNRKTLEDIVLVYKNIKLNNKIFDIFCVLDGHGGNECIEYFKLHFLTEFTKTFKDQNITKDKINIFFDNFDSNIETNNIKSGLCFGIILLNNNENFNENCNENFNEHFCFILGDVKFILKYKNNIEISPSHNFMNSKELKRFEKNKIQIKNKNYKGLNVTRNLGNFDIKSKSEKLFLSKPFFFQFKDYDTIYLFSDGCKYEYIKFFNFKIQPKDLIFFLKKNNMLEDNISVLKIEKI